MWLVVTTAGDDEGQVVALPLPEGEFSLGRAGDCDLVVADERLSRRHLVFLRRGTELRIRDEGSSTGILLNGSALSGAALSGTAAGAKGCARGEALLALGDRIEVGQTLLRIESRPPEARSGRSKGGPGGGGIDVASLLASLGELRRSSDARKLLERLLKELVTLMDAHRGFVLLREGQGKDLVPVASHAIEDTESFVAVSSTLTARALEEGRLVQIHDSQADDRCRQALTFAEDDEARSVLCCPLQSDGKSFGVIYLDRPRQVRPVSPERLGLLETFAGLASERLAGNRFRAELVEAEGRIDALNQLAWEGDRLVMGDGPWARSFRDQLEAAASQDTTVLLLGETGTGKEMVARAIHRRSRRRSGPFVPVNCAALPLELIDAELFGAEKGAFTGATALRKGRFELARGGTLFLDEVGELPPAVQVKLLRVLQERRLTRLGGKDPVSLDFRLLAATNRDLEAGLRDGSFRSDFYYRINVFRLELLPLRQRLEDLPPLLKHFLLLFARRFGKKLVGYSDEAKALLLGHDWPGNVRELKNAIERAVVVARHRRIRPEDLPIEAAALPSASPPGHGHGKDGVHPTADPVSDVFAEASDAFERAFLERALARHEGNLAAVVRETGLARPTVYRWLERFALDLEDFRKTR